MIFDVSNGKEEDYYAIIAIFGVEYAFNLGERDLNGFQTWLRQHQNRSPLFEATVS